MKVHYGFWLTLGMIGAVLILLGCLNKPVAEATAGDYVISVVVRDLSTAKCVRLAVPVTTIPGSYKPVGMKVVPCPTEIR